MKYIQSPSRIDTVITVKSPNQRKQAYLIGFIAGVGLTVSAFTYVFFATTITYKSSLFPGKHIALVAHRSFQ